MLSQAAVLACVESVQTHRLRLYVRELVLQHELSHADRGADESSSEVDHGLKCGRYMGVGLAWSGVHGVYDAVEEGCWSGSARVEKVERDVESISSRR